MLSMAQVAPLQVKEPKSSLASSVTLMVAPNGLVLIPRLEVATHWTPVPVLRSTKPEVPAELLVSRSRPVIRRLVVVALLETMRLEVEAVEVAVRLEKVAVPENAGLFEKTARLVPVSSPKIPESSLEVSISEERITAPAR